MCSLPPGTLTARADGHATNGTPRGVVDLCRVARRDEPPQRIAHSDVKPEQADRPVGRHGGKQAVGKSGSAPCAQSAVGESPHRDVVGHCYL